MASILPAMAGARATLSVRCWEPGDVDAVEEAVAISREHLLPSMSWAAEPRMSPEQWRMRVSEWDRARTAGGDAVYGIFLDGAVAGGCGLHRRLGPNGLEIGYWVHVDYLRRGIASTSTEILIHTAFALPQITHLEIHHDKANAASGAVPRSLGFTFCGEWQDQILAPAESGIECRWRMERADWLARKGS